MGNKEATVKVFEAFRQDIGYNRARIDHQIRSELNLSIGDIIELEGTKVTTALVWRAHPSDEGKRLIRIDNLTMKNAGTSAGDTIKIRPVDITIADDNSLGQVLKRSSV